MQKLNVKSNAEEDQGSFFTKKRVLIGAGLVLALILLYYMFFSDDSWFGGDADAGNDRLIDEGLKDLPGDASIPDFSQDPGEPMVVVSSDTLTSEVADAIFDKYESKVTSMADKIDVPLDEVLTVVGQTLLASAMTGDTISTKAMEIYMDHLNIWLPIYTMADKNLMDQVGKLTAELMNINTESMTCTETTFQIDTEETLKEVTDKSLTTIGVTKKSGGFLGMNKKKTTTEESTLNNITTSEGTMRISYVPHCTSWGITRSIYLANVSSYTLGLSALYAQFQTVLDACPDPKNYLISES